MEFKQRTRDKSWGLNIPSSLKCEVYLFRNTQISCSSLSLFAWTSDISDFFFFGWIVAICLPTIFFLSTYKLIKYAFFFFFLNKLWQLGSNRAFRPSQADADQFGWMVVKRLGMSCEPRCGNWIIYISLSATKEKQVI